MSRSKITVMNMALSASGQADKKITAASTGPEFALMDAHYNEIVAAAFEDGDFHFGKIRAALTNRSAGDFGKNDKYLVPEEALHIVKVLVSGYPTEDWERNGDYIYINATANVTVEYVAAGEEHTWSAKFTRGIVEKLEALLRRSINEEFEEGANMDQEADFTLLKAGTHSSAQRGPRRAFKSGFLLNTRRHGPQRFYRRGKE